MKLEARQIAIERILRQSGAPGTKKGFWCAVWGISFALEDPTILWSVTGRLYPAIGEVCAMPAANVGRDLRSLVDWCWSLGDREALSRLAGRPLMVKPSVGEFIDLFATYIRCSALSEQL